MTYRSRASPLSPEISPSSSATDISKCKYHRKILKGKRQEGDDYVKDSQSQLPYESEESDYKDEEYSTNADTDVSYTRSESVNNAPSDQFSSPATDKSVPQSNIFHAIASSNSATDSPTPFQPITTQTSSSYINIAPLPIFHGTADECPVTHLSRFNKVCRANNVASIDMMMRIFPITLDNEAALWYDLNIEPYYSSLNWEEIKSSFLEAYRRTEVIDPFRSELMVINQGNEESVRSYFLRLQWTLKKCPNHGLPDGLLKGIFIDGLREDFQDWIIPQKPESLDDALKLAFNWEQVQSIRAARRKDLKKCGFCDGAHEEMGCGIRRRMRELWVKSKEEKELIRVNSMRIHDQSNSGDAGEDEREEGAGMLSWKKNSSSSQCQCWKHQCWKKKLERNNSVL